MTVYRKTASTVTALVVAGGLLLGGILADRAALAQTKGKTATLSGTISDNMCGAKHPAGENTKQCTVDCVKSMGANYTLVVGDKVYTLKGKDADVAKFAGAKAKVTGTVDGTEVQVSSIAAGS
jgi:hypothetical protein